MSIFTRVAPSILAIDYNNKELLKQKLAEIEDAGANFVHLDVMDGKFVKEKSFDHTFVDYVKSNTTLMLDVHLMINNPEEYVDKYIAAGADILTFHYEATNDPEKLLRYIKSKNVLAGLSIKPNTPALKIRELLNKNLVDVVLVMSVEPGKSGQSFIAGSAEKVAEIREMDKNVYIEVDGGVNNKNCKMLRKLGANILVSGAYIFESKSIHKAIATLKGKAWANIMHSFV